MGTPLKGELIPATTDRQKRGVKNILSGKFKNKKEALMAAGYSDSVARKPADFVRSPSVQKYLQLLDVESRKKFNGQGIEDKVIEVYTEGLSATKLFGKNAKEHPDWLARKAFADKIGGMLGIGGSDQGGGDNNNQYNFFMFGKEEKEEFNEAFGEFVKNHNKSSS